ncbi:helix-turn-helix domain-containing protein [Candidatus Peregrinibacteria bacterium]|nr:helix-turn-helix domain-containing protein [Candidatus Peregrinibacteria bacterium]
MTYNTHTRQLVENLRRRAKNLELSSGAKLRLSWFAYALDHAGNISLTCKHFGISRSTYHRWAGRFDPENARSLEEQSKRPHRTRKEETPAFVIELIRFCRLEHPTMSKDAIARRLLEEHGLLFSASTVGRVIARHGFFFASTKSHRLKRMIFEAAQTFSPTPRKRGSIHSIENQLGIFAS